MSVKDMLDARDAYELQILSNYKNVLDDVFKFTYKVDGRVNWERITRFSPVSNFALISGVAELPDEYVIVDDNDEETILAVNFTIPITALDDGSTVSDIAKLAQRIGTLRAILDADEYFDLLMCADFTMENVYKIVDQYDDADVTEALDAVPNTTVPVPPPSLVDFDIDALTEEQRKALDLHMATSK